MPPLTCGALLLAICMSFHVTTAVADLCSGGSNVFTEVPENSPFGTPISLLTVLGDPQGETIRLTLSGIDSDWFYLDGKTVRLNTSEEKVLDREAMDTPVLMVSFTCTEDGFLPTEYRIIVQVMNENDNKPRFREDSILTRNISELAPIHSVVFSTQAEDADGDTLIYVIDSTTADARYFRIDLPNSGKIVLAKALDFETKRHLEFVVHVVEMNTKERYNCSARIRVNVMDGDDQYPQFLPCNFLSHDGVGVCVSPVYTANVTEGEVKTGPLQFLPGPVHAEDGDSDLKAPITYSILSGTDHGYFHIDNVTGSITMLRPVQSRFPTAVYSLSVMASQVNDAKKYVVTEVRVRILSANHHAPRFERSRYQAFVHEDHKMASLVVTYSGRVLPLTVSDMDFADGFNPAVRYSLKRQSNHTQLFQITPGGLLVARANHLRAFERYSLQIIARDEESGEAANATVDVEILTPGQAVPLDPLEAVHQGSLDAGILAGSLGALLLVTAAVLFLILHAMKKRQRRQQNMERAALAMEKHPNVSLKWFQPVNAGKAMPEAVYFQNEGYSDVGDEPPKTYGGPMLNSQPPSARSAKTLPAREAPVANSVGRFESPLAGARSPPKEPEEASKGALLNGKTVERLSRPAGPPEDKTEPQGSGDERPRPEAQTEAQVVGQQEESLLPNVSEDSEEEEEEIALGAVGEPPCPPEPQPLEKEEVDACRGSSHEEPTPQSPPPERDSVDDGGGGSHTPPLPQVMTESPESSRDTPSVAVGGAELLVPQKDPGAPLPMPKEVPKLALEEEEEEEEEDGEETPRAASPTYQDPLAPLPVSDVRMPVTLLQLLEDSIEC